VVNLPSDAESRARRFTGWPWRDGWRGSRAPLLACEHVHSWAGAWPRSLCEHGTGGSSAAAPRCRASGRARGGAAGRGRWVGHERAAPPALVQAAGAPSAAAGQAGTSERGPVHSGRRPAPSPGADAGCAARRAGEHERHVQRDHDAARAGAGGRAHRDHDRLLPPHAPVHPDRAAQDGHLRDGDRPGRPARAGVRAGAAHGARAARVLARVRPCARASLRACVLAHLRPASCRRAAARTARLGASRQPVQAAAPWTGGGSPPPATHPADPGALCSRAKAG